MTLHLQKYSAYLSWTSSTKKNVYMLSKPTKPSCKEKPVLCLYSIWNALIYRRELFKNIELVAQILLKTRGSLPPNPSLHFFLKTPSTIVAIPDERQQARSCHGKPCSVILYEYLSKDIALHFTEFLCISWVLLPRWADLLWNQNQESLSLFAFCNVSQQIRVRTYSSLTRKFQASLVAGNINNCKIPWEKNAFI